MRSVWLIAVALSLGLNTAVAGQMSYRYLEVSYLDTDIGVADGDGGAIGGSWLWRDNWIAFGRYSESTVEGPLGGGDVEADFEYIRAGVGYRNVFPWFRNTDWYGLLSYNEIDLSDFEDEPESGEDFELGLRHALTPSFELNLAARYFYSNIDMIDLLAGEAGFTVGALWQITPGIGVKLGYEDIDRFNELQVGLRGSW